MQNILFVKTAYLQQHPSLVSGRILLVFSLVRRGNPGCSQLLQVPFYLSQTVVILSILQLPCLVLLSCCVRHKGFWGPFLRMSWDPIWEDLNSISGRSRFVSNLNSSACLDSKDAKSSVLNVSDTRVVTNHHSRHGASTADRAEPAFD